MRPALGWATTLALTVALSGCGKGRPPLPASTGARQAAQGYFEALNRQDWRRAYELLHSDCRQRWTEQQFASLAENWRRGLGFEPLKVRVTTCQEQGDQAIAHVVLQGQTAVGKGREHRDAILLRRDSGAWTCWPADNFGR